MVSSTNEHGTVVLRLHGDRDALGVELSASIQDLRECCEYIRGLLDFQLAGADLHEDLSGQRTYHLGVHTGACRAAHAAAVLRHLICVTRGSSTTTTATGTTNTDGSVGATAGGHSGSPVREPGSCAGGGSAETRASSRPGAGTCSTAPAASAAGADGAPLEVDGSNAADLLFLADLWCLAAVKGRVLACLRRTACNGFRRPVAGSASVEGVPQVALLLRQGMDFGLGDADGGLRKLYGECTSYMGAWPARLWPTRTFAGLRRPIQDDVLAAASAAVTPHTAPAVLAACRCLAATLPAGLAWAARVREMQEELTHHVLSYTWQHFRTVCVSAGRRRDRSEDWAGLLEQLRAWVAEHPDPDTAVGLLPCWTATARDLLHGPGVGTGGGGSWGGAAEEESWLGEEEAQHMQALHDHLRSYMVRHAALVARCPAFRALCPAKQQALLELGSGAGACGGSGWGGLVGLGAEAAGGDARTGGGSSSICNSSRLQGGTVARVGLSPAGGGRRRSGVGERAGDVGAGSRGCARGAGAGTGAGAGAGLGGRDARGEGRAAGRAGVRGGAATATGRAGRGAAGRGGAGVGQRGHAAAAAMGSLPSPAAVARHNASRASGPAGAEPGAEDTQEQVEPDQRRQREQRQEQGQKQEQEQQQQQQDEDVGAQEQQQGEVGAREADAAALVLQEDPHTPRHHSTSAALEHPAAADFASPTRLLPPSEASPHAAFASPSLPQPPPVPVHRTAPTSTADPGSTEDPAAGPCTSSAAALPASAPRALHDQPAPAAVTTTTAPIPCSGPATNADTGTRPGHPSNTPSPLTTPTVPAGRLAVSRAPPDRHVAPAPATSPANRTGYRTNSEAHSAASTAAAAAPGGALGRSASVRSAAASPSAGAGSAAAAPGTAASATAASLRRAASSRPSAARSPTVLTPSALARASSARANTATQPAAPSPNAGAVAARGASRAGPAPGPAATAAPAAARMSAASSPPAAGTAHRPMPSCRPSPAPATAASPAGKAATALRAAPSSRATGGAPRYAAPTAAAVARAKPQPRGVDLRTPPPGAKPLRPRLTGEGTGRGPTAGADNEGEDESGSGAARSGESEGEGSSGRGAAPYAGGGSAQGVQAAEAADSGTDCGGEVAGEGMGVHVAIGGFSVDAAGSAVGSGVQGAVADGPSAPGAGAATAKVPGGGNSGQELLGTIRTLQIAGTGGGAADGDDEAPHAQQQQQRQEPGRAHMQSSCDSECGTEIDVGGEASSTCADSASVAAASCSADGDALVATATTDCSPAQPTADEPPQGLGPALSASSHARSGSPAAVQGTGSSPPKVASPGARLLQGPATPAGQGGGGALGVTIPSPGDGSPGSSSSLSPSAAAAFAAAEAVKARIAALTAGRVSKGGSREGYTGGSDAASP